MVAYGAKSIILEVYIKNPHFMKLNRKEYDLVYDAFQYMYFKMDKDQRVLAEQILDLAFYDAPEKGSHEMLEGLGLDPITREVA